MSFSFTAGGTPEETLSSLRALTPEQLGFDVMAADMRDLLVKHLEGGSAKLESDYQVYHVVARGHSGPGAAITLHVNLEIGSRQPEITPADQAIPDPRAAQESDS